jgi:outer membrane receptor protein involved in Fe transport
MLKRLTVLAAFLATTALLAAPATAQGLQTGNLSGTVTSADGMTLPGATVTVSSPALIGTRSTVTDTNGNYIVRGLPPGRYTVVIEFPGMSTVKEEVTVPLGDTARLDGNMAVAAVAEEVTVTGSTPGLLATTQTGENFRVEEIDLLPAPRTLAGIATLAPGLTDNTPNAGQVTIAGSMAYDNVFLVDGVDVNDNLFGTANNLFIEDAIEETQVLTSGISAEYGRFMGGVVNAITRSGGNQFSGSYRLNLTNESWTRQTPFERDRGIERADLLSQFHEGTFGGPILRDQFWFFTAGRFQDSEAQGTFPETGLPMVTSVENKRGEIKLTGNVFQNHTVSGTYLNNATNQVQPSFPGSLSVDPATYVDRTLPNYLFVTSWRGVLTPTVFATAQVSRRHFGFRNTGGTSTNVIDSPYFTRGVTPGVTATRHYNAPYWDANDPEDRNNWQIAASVAHFRSTNNLGTHDIKGGFERFVSTRTGGNSQTATGFVMSADYLVSGGQPVFGADGRIIPTFRPAPGGIGSGANRLEQWIPTIGAQLDLTTDSFFVHDRWAFNRNWTFDLGLRYERVRGEATGDIQTADTSTIVPRLGASFDPRGDGRLVLQATFGEYSGKYNEAQFGRITPVGTPSLVLWEYLGPEGQGVDFMPAYELSNYRIIGGNFPLQSVRFTSDLQSPTAREFTAAVGTSFRRGGHAKLTYVQRDFRNFIESFQTMDIGQVNVTHQGTNFGRFDITEWRNTNEPIREYRAVQLQTRFDPLAWLPMHASWTMQFRNHGTFEGEGTNTPGIGSVFGLQPEMRVFDRNEPYGRLDDFQRHKVRMWTVLPANLWRLGRADVGLMYRYDSPLTYSIAAAGVPMTAQQRALDPGYARPFASQTVFFGERGRGEFEARHLFDTSVSYQIPIWRTLGPWFKFEVFNVFNHQPLMRHNTTVTADFNGPVDGFGLPLNYIQGATFGQATTAAHYPRPRTFQMALGFRF